MQDVKVCSFEGSEDKKLCAYWERYPSLSYSCRIVCLCSFRLLLLDSLFHRHPARHDEALLLCSWLDALASLLAHTYSPLLSNRSLIAEALRHNIYIMSSTFIFISPIKRRQCCTAFTSPLSSNNMNQLCAAPSKYHHQQSGHYQRVPFHPSIVCSPLVCRSNKLKLQHEEDTTTSTSSLADTDDVVSLINIESTSHMLDSFEIGYNHIDSMYTSGDPTRKEAPLVTATAQYPSKGNGNGGLLIKECRVGIRTRNHFQPSRKYEKVWEDITPPSTAAKTRHSDVKARSKRINEQISL